MARRGRKSSVPPGAQLPDTKVTGGRWSPFQPDAVARVADAAIDILCTIGLSEAPDAMVQAVMARGGSETGDGRLIYPRDLVLEAIAQGPKQVLLAGRGMGTDMTVGGQACYTGTGGAAPMLFDPETQSFRPSSLSDLHDAARVADSLPHVHFFSRTLVARDIENPRDLDLATAAASLMGTGKHVMVQALEPDHVGDIAALCHEIAGGEDAFRARPFLSLNINHIVPPLRVHGTSVEVLMAAVEQGIPVLCNVFGQLGASSPVTLAGSVAQTMAEVLAGVVLVYALDPQAPVIAGPRPMITDLKTGGMAGGAGEQAMATALAVQVARLWDLPVSVIAGATDSKLADFQAGYEKALSISTALQAGANLITQAAGTQAGLMAGSHGAMVADNDMLGAILRGNVTSEVSEQTLALEAIAEVVRGEGHFLGRPETYERMRSDFLYPDVADRQSLEEWEASDKADMARRATARAQEILQAHWSAHLPEEVGAELGARFGLRKR